MSKVKACNNSSFVKKESVLMFGPCQLHSLEACAKQPDVGALL